MERDARLHRYGMLTPLLASAGHKVTWWTSNFSHTPKIFVCDDDWEEKINGVTLRILKGLGYKRNISLARFQHHAHFARRFFDEARKGERPDLIVSPVPTLEVAAAAVRFGLENGIPVLTDIRDEWPDEFLYGFPRPVQWLGRIALDGYFRKMRFICRNVTGIMAISKRQLEYGLKFAGRGVSENDGVFPLGYSSTQNDPGKVAEATKWWNAQGIDGKSFVGCLFSAINNRLNLRTVVNAAKVLEKEFSVKFVICGHGKMLAETKSLAKGVPSVIFPGWVNAPQIASLMEMSHVGLAPYAKNVRMALPNKPFEYFGGGLPVVSSLQGELKDLLAEHNCGLTYNSESVEEFCFAIRFLHRDPDMRRVMGDRGRRLLNERFATKVIFTKMQKHLELVRARFLKRI
ncbi:MAG: glycosyltransferase family 4 protein [Pseudomonadota bacterium]